jgi:hypothetical protein
LQTSDVDPRSIDRDNVAQNDHIQGEVEHPDRRHKQVMGTSEKDAAAVDVTQDQGWPASPFHSSEDNLEYPISIDTEDR